jgi:hypothetical protein
MMQKIFFGLLFSIQQKVEKTLLTLGAFGGGKGIFRENKFCSDIPLPQQVFLS